MGGLGTAANRFQSLPMFDQRQVDTFPEVQRPTVEPLPDVSAPVVPGAAQTVDHGLPTGKQTQKPASTGETGYNRIEADSIRHEGKTFRNLVAGIDSSVSAFFEKWRNGRKGRPDEKLEKLYLGRMSDGTRAAVSDILGYEVSERDFIVTNDGVKHILDTHGGPGSRG